jgi:FkbM family methyltransferase
LVRSLQTYSLKVKMKYSIVIPTYNHCNDLLKPCVESIFKYTDVTNIELIISANGCKDETLAYVTELQSHYALLGISENLKVVWNDAALGYSRACNAGIEVATTDLIVLLNNDTVLLPQEKNRWLTQLESVFIGNEKAGISCLIKSESEPAGHDFAIFFCVMIHRRVFDKIGLLSLDYGAGGGEDTEFSIECERAGFQVLECVDKEWNAAVGMYCGDFPIYHLGEGTVHDKELVPEWEDIFLTNSLTLARKYNPHWYQWRLSNYWERAVFFKGDEIAPREITRYSWAAQNILGNNVFELGCSSGYGLQFLPEGIEYTGLDYDKRIIPVARDQQWRDNVTFVHGDINTYELGQYDTIIAFEVIEHLDNGLAIVEKLKKHCKRLMITVPMLETPGLWGPHHKIHNLDESFFPGFKFKFIAPDGTLRDTPHNRGDKENINLMLCIWDKEEITIEESLKFLNEQDPAMYREVIEANQYHLTKEKVKDRLVVDIGANIGAFSLYAAALGAKQVISVEPISASYNTFLRNIHRMQMKNITTHKRIIAEKGNEFLPVSLNSNAGANSMYNVSDNYEVVETATFSQLMGQIAGHDILLKLDCEGGEYDVIMNADEKDMVRINEIMLEIHTDLHPKHKGKDILEQKLIEFGFTRLDSVQIYYWDWDANGQPVNYREAPFVNQHWKK